jgi:hypothetical protein
LGLFASTGCVLVDATRPTLAGLDTIIALSQIEFWLIWRDVSSARSFLYSWFRPRGPGGPGGELEPVDAQVMKSTDLPGLWEYEHCQGTS